ncbi:putative uncharacterized protein DDB_G0282499 [Melitaea cinxia]|uniref:putative uncharacterized protein DDB_G0282499 n=1 Tax=Melitaea cinxia TaxID=113334 RepID=UPI001E270821|nr:putative uncharacterized protein DDB_G0282499 [Melitaea cinxia]
MQRKSADNPQARNNEANKNEDATSRLCSERASEGKYNADIINVITNKPKDDLCLEYTQDNISKVDAVDTTIIKNLSFSNTPTLPNSVSKVQTTNEDNVLKLISQINQEKSTNEYIEDSISAIDAHVKPDSHTSENTRAKYLLNMLQNSQKGEGIADNNEIITKENKEFELPFQNKQVIIGTSQVETINEDKKHKPPLKTVDKAYDINDIEANSNSIFLLQGKNEHKIEEKITPSEDQILLESGIVNETVNLTTFNTKDLIYTTTGQRTNNEIDVKTTTNDDYKLKLTSKNTFENVCNANKCEENNSPECLLLINEHEKNFDENMTINNKKLQGNRINNETIDTITIRNSNLNDLQRTQKVTTDDKLKLPFKNVKQSIGNECEIEISKTSPTSSLQDTHKHTANLYKENIILEKDKLQLF